MKRQIHTTRSATPNARDGKAVSENDQRGIANGRIGRPGGSLRSARRIRRGSEADIAWKNAETGHTLAGNKPNGECPINAGDGRGKFSTTASQLQPASKISSGAGIFRALPN